MAKAERLLQIVNLLKARRVMNARKIAQECNISERTVYRDVLALSSINVPIYFDKGYRLLPDAFLPTLNFTLEELLAIESALRYTPLYMDESFAKLAKRVYEKIRSSVPESLKQEVRKLESSEQAEKKETETFSKAVLNASLIEKAIEHENSIYLSFLRRCDGIRLGGECKIGCREILVNPYALVFKARFWSVLAYCTKCGLYLAYKLTSLRSVSLTQKKFQPDRSFKALGLIPLVMENPPFNTFIREYDLQKTRK
ncbi:MAG: HTH domain-containing protein [candidate division Zixibacteria bacterium]|nr:HTH domain-containing protein [candidate division Zixibacteria bacterium]